MQKIVFILLAIIIINFLFCGCGINNNSKKFEKWTGDYHYEESPVQANAGYAMVMNWTLSISKQNDSCTGILEVNGQQTFMKLKTFIRGNTSKIAVIYNSLLDGNDEQLKSGDTLFTLSTVSGILTTNWVTMKPRLIDNSSKECNCFSQINARNSSRQ
ncbi:MAG: DUF5991 domain-containing protein [Bacteroidota bacterium]